MTFDAYDVVVVPFPFTDRATTKRRPALVLSRAESINSGAGHSIMAMITSAAHSSWPLDTSLEDLDAAGLPAPSVVRMKLFTLDNTFIVRQAGRLAPTDCRAVAAALGKLLPAGT